eukprot:gnl/TRDRNA2_/TRDRNA2_145276_c0_seq1.p1 gnl/TRDRNA2_/TRDRNA2_145276_c0~~gnl/TRDRNA2_/TRDRNA2_145276_c0_seq1.p1  ORF type:complete len:431 (+),score=61.06 gnl/TRDRNA2_/TRDRNA2_145276_c0_seq1:73-1293(+)
MAGKRSRSPPAFTDPESLMVGVLPQAALPAWKVAALLFGGAVIGMTGSSVFFRRPAQKKPGKGSFPAGSPFEDPVSMAIPTLERAAATVSAWINFLPDHCDAFADSFAQTGDFAIAVAGKRHYMKSQREVKELCQSVEKLSNGFVSKKFRVVSYFPDFARDVYAALVDDFYTSPELNNKLTKLRLAMYIELESKKGAEPPRIKYFRLLNEQDMKGQVEGIPLTHPAYASIGAYLKQYNDHDCSGWKEAMADIVEIEVQMDPRAVHAPGSYQTIISREAYLEGCAKMEAYLSNRTWIQHADLDGVFLSETLIIVFFKKEVLYVNNLLFHDEPDAIVLWLRPNEQKGGEMEAYKGIAFNEDAMTVVSDWYKSHGSVQRGQMEALGAEVKAAAKSGQRIHLGSPEPGEL